MNENRFIINYFVEQRKMRIYNVNNNNKMTKK